jgi:hypothetical protein
LTPTGAPYARRRNANPNYLGLEQRKDGKAKYTRHNPLLDKTRLFSRLRLSPGSIWAIAKR